MVSKRTLSELRKDTPTCSKESVGIALSIASAKGWNIHSTDVRAAFLQGSKIEREVYLRPPAEYNSGQL